MVRAYKKFGSLKKSAYFILAGLSTSLVAFGEVHFEDIQIFFEDRASADSIIALHPDIEFERVIPLALDQEMEARHRESGIDLWYVVRPSLKTKSRAISKFKKSNGIRGVFDTQLITMPELPSVPMENFIQQESRHSTVTRSLSTMNDPLYSRQWHYDMINLEKAWELEQGSRNVIVAVMDGWIDHTHPDLAPNMWVNETELNGQPGVDDDGNGYIDDIYGYNTSSDPDYYSPHGTHVAGTIAAVNNNGIGVCGVAGGNGSDTGVRLMSIGIVNGGQIADWEMARGFVYAADNGAVISQNSWQNSSTSQSKVLNDAISYFMENAGQMPGSPMKGGLVVFAAGNDNSNIPHSPLNGQTFDRNRFITVGGISAEKIRTSFSNYGWWVDVAAPAGEQDGTSIMSTAPDEGYMLMNGTSMACPHVSGVAALIVSKFASADLTPEFVKSRIISTAIPLECYQAGYGHEKETTLGLVNAYGALCDVNKETPGIPQDFTIKMHDYSTGVFSWTIATDSNGNPPSEYRIYGGNEEVPYAIVKTSGAQVGTRFEYFDKTGYLTDFDEYTIEAIDCDGNRSGRSAPSSVVDGTSELAIVNPYQINHFVLYKPSAPGFTESFGDVTLEFYVTCVGHPYEVEIESAVDFVKLNHIKNVCTVKFDLTDDTPADTYPVTLRVYKLGDREDAVLLPMTITVKEPLCYNGGVTCESEDHVLTTVETSQRTGSISIDLAKYLTHPWGSDFKIIEIDKKTEDESFFMGYVLTYSINDGILNAEYDFTSAFTFSQATIRVDAVDEYMKSTQFYVNIIFSENFSGIEDVVPDKSHYKSGIYTINGVKLDCEVENLPSGIYIINGKKVLINRK